MSIPLLGRVLSRTNFSVFPVDSNGVVTYKGWKFTNAWMKTLGGVSFDQAWFWRTHYHHSQSLLREVYSRNRSISF